MSVTGQLDTRKGNMKRTATLIAGLILALGAPGTAMASSTCQAYNPQTCNVVSTSTTAATGATGTTPNSATPNSTTASATNDLPFTGLDVALLLAGGGLLLGTGLVVRRISRRIN